MSLKVSVLAAAAIAVFTAGPAYALDVANGDFNIGNFGGLGDMATTSVAGWTVDAGDVDVKAVSFWQNSAGPVWASLLAAKPGSNVAGDQFLDLSGNNPGAISQSLATQAGATYSLSFDFAANPWSDNTASFEVKLTWGGGNVSQVFNGANAWGAGSIDFTPDGQTTLAFRSLTPVDMPDSAAKRSGALLDNIAVSGPPAFAAFTAFQEGPNLDSIEGNVAPVPEPETYAMMALGLGLVGFMARRRQRQA